MQGNVEVRVRAFNDAGEEVEVCVAMPAAEEDLRLAALAGLQESGFEIARKLGLSPSETMQVLVGRIGAMTRALSESDK